MSKIHYFSIKFSKIAKLNLFDFGDLKLPTESYVSSVFKFDYDEIEL